MSLVAPNETIKPGRGGTLDALRFAAAFFVVLFHYGDEAPVVLAQVHPIFVRGYLATDFFLMLSGYVLGRAYGAVVEDRRLVAGEFLTRRISRIWPPHLIVLAAMAVLLLVAGLVGHAPHHPGRFQWSDLPPQIVLIQAWGDFGELGWNIPTWSLSALVVCYGLFPALWRMLSRAPLTVVVGAAVAALWLADRGSHYFIHQGLFDLPYYFGVFRALPLFLAGTALALWVKRAPLPRGVAIAGGLAAATVFVLIQSFGRHDMVSVGMVAVIILCAGSLPIARPSRLAAAAGRLSFSLFITHVLVAVFWFGALHAVNAQTLPAGARWALWFGALPAAILAAYAFDRLVDHPVQVWLAPRLKAIFRPRPGRYPEREPNG